MLILVFSYLPILIFQDYSKIDSFAFWGRFFGLSGIVTLLWMYLLGIRAIFGKVIPDLFWINKIHKQLGIYGITILLTHPILLFIFYDDLGINLLSLKIETEFDRHVLFGKIASSFLVLTWCASIFLRKKLSFRWWKKIHFAGYIVLPLSLIHSIEIGLNLQKSNGLSLYFILIGLIYFFAVIYRILFRLGFFRLKYKVLSTTKITKDVVKIDLKPVTKRLKINPGQFIYLQRNVKSETHPFTVSHIDESTNNISITVKKLGKFTEEIQKISKDEVVIIDGAYGVFTSEVTNKKPIILIAGGIGITPFLWIFEGLKSGFNKEVILFYGNKTEDGIAFRPMLEDLNREISDFKMINVISADPKFLGEKGFINFDLIKKYVNDELNNYNIFVSGPPILISKITKELLRKGVKKENLFKEEFSL